MSIADIPTDGRTITYSTNQYRKCGKADCKKCQEGRGHGPYTYAYWHISTHKLKSVYVGKTLPEGVSKS